MAETRPTLYLVSCVSLKQATRAPARELYTSPWFVKARDYVERKRSPWLILSAKHGAVEPDVPIDPYDETLNRMPVDARRAWADRVLGQLTPHLRGVGSIVLFAGARYRQFLAGPLREHGTVEIPLEGLGIGRQLSWFTMQNTAST